MATFFRRALLRYGGGRLRLCIPARPASSVNLSQNAFLLINKKVGVLVPPFLDIIHPADGGSSS